MKPRSALLALFTPHRTLQLTVLTIVTLLSAACSRSHPAPQACRLLSESSVRSVIGDFSKPRQEAHDASAQSARASQCTYHRRASRVAGVLDVLVRRGEETEIHPDQISAHEASMRTYVGQDYSLERIPNLGTSAGWDPKLNQLTVFDRSDLLILTLPPDISGDKAKEAAVQLAKEALAKLR